jgi:hypothetical protein
VDEIAIDMEELGYAVQPARKVTSTWGDIKLAY